MTTGHSTCHCPPTHPLGVGAQGHLAAGTGACDTNVVACCCVFFSKLEGDAHNPQPSADGALDAAATGPLHPTAEFPSQMRRGHWKPRFLSQGRRSVGDTRARAARPRPRAASSLAEAGPEPQEAGGPLAAPDRLRRSSDGFLPPTALAGSHTLKTPPSLVNLWVEI